MNSIWYKTPAEKWDDAFAVGNGRLGAMVWGNADHEILDINEESLWSKPYTNRNNKNAASALKDIRDLLKLERNSEAQELIYENFSGHPEESAWYKSAGRVHIDFYDEESFGLRNSDGVRKISGETVFYKRELDLETAIASTSFTKETVIPSKVYLSRNTSGSSVTYNREVFASTREDVIAVHIWASTPKSISLRASLENPAASKKFSCGGDTIALQCFDGIPSAMLLNAVSSSGKISVTENSVIVERADEVTLFIDVETAFSKRSFAKNSHKPFNSVKLASWCYDRALKKLCFAANIPYLSIKKNHINENMNLNSRMSLSLGSSSPEEEPQEIPEASALAATPDSPLFAQMYYRYSRYLLLASTKERGSLPLMEQGLFMNPQNESKHLRYNFCSSTAAEMAGSLCNAKKSDLNWFKFLRRLDRNARQTAFQMFGLAGTVAFGSTDLWADTAPCGTDLSASYNPLGLAQLAGRITDYYEYTLDKKFIRRHINILRHACEFYENYLVLQNEKTQAVLIPAGVKNGENFLQEGNPEAERTIAALFRSALKAFAYADVPSSEDYVVRAKDFLSKLPAAEEKSEPGPFLPESASFMADNFKNLAAMTKRIISSELNGNVLTVNVLPGATGALECGCLKNLSLKGNLFVNLTWKNGRIESGNLFTKSSGSFIENVIISYQGKKFPARLMNGAISLMNVLPTTV